VSIPQRILIAGGPRTGKTRLSNDIKSLHSDFSVYHTDDLIDKLDWSAASLEVSLWLDIKQPPWVIEGVSVPRALRKWFAKRQELSSKPCDVIFWLDKPYVELTPGQITMAKGCVKVWREIIGDLHKRGVKIIYGRCASEASLRIVLES
jgi:hypothetical protein